MVVTSRIFIALHFLLLDTQPPRVDKCISPPPFMRRDKDMEITWEDPIFSDNSFEAVNIIKSHKPGIFPLGTTLVTYIAYDKDNNTAKCVLEITVQGMLNKIWCGFG